MLVHAYMISVMNEKATKILNPTDDWDNCNFCEYTRFLQEALEERLRARYMVQARRMDILEGYIKLLADDPELLTSKVIDEMKK